MLAVRSKRGSMSPPKQPVAANSQRLVNFRARHASQAGMQMPIHSRPRAEMTASRRPAITHFMPDFRDTATTITAQSSGAHLLHVEMSLANDLLLQGAAFGRA